MGDNLFVEQVDIFVSIFLRSMASAPVAHVENNKYISFSFKELMQYTTIIIIIIILE